MNYKVSVYAGRPEGKRCYLLEADGRRVSEKVSTFKGDNIKENALECVLQGLTACKPLVTHHDYVVVEVQNRHLNDWLNDFSQSTGYENYDNILDKIFEVLDNLDCRYKFVFVKNSYVKKFLHTAKLSEVKVGSVDSLMSEFK